METANPLTSKQRDVLRFIRRYQAKHGYAPTFREIGEAGGYTHTAARQHVAALERKACLRQTDGVPRSIVILPAGFNEIA